MESRRGRVLAMKTFHLSIAELSQTLGFNKIDDLSQGRLDYRLMRSRRGKSQNRALPQLLTAALGDRDIELIANPRLKAL